MRPHGGCQAWPQSWWLWGRWDRGGEGCSSPRGGGGALGRAMGTEETGTGDVRLGCSPVQVKTPGSLMGSKTGMSLSILLHKTIFFQGK